MTGLVFPTSYVARAHTTLSSAAFAVALLIGLLYHYKKIVKNSVAEFPLEWWPSVSATIGDWYPERNLFQILIAFTSGPRLGLVFLEYLLHSKAWDSKIPAVIFICGIVRTIACGGWVYITSSDDHDIHDFFMILYMVLNLPWMLGCIACAPIQTRRKRFFLSIIPLVYFFIQHKVHKIPGAYTRYSFVEWSLIVFDVLFDSFTEEELKCADLQIFVGDNSFAIQPTGKGGDIDEGTTESEVVEASVAEPKVPKDPDTELASGEKKSSKTQFALKLEIPSSWRPALSFASSIYLSYIFWSIFTSLIPTLFYFSIWELGLTGQELALLSTLSPIFLSINPLLSWARSHEGSTTLYALSLLGLVAFVLDKPIHRLGLVFFASAVVTLKEVTNWAAVDVEYQSLPTATQQAKSKAKATPPSSGVPLRGHWLKGALPLGSLIFTLHSLLSDSSTLISWSWTGYINGQPQGPLPHLHGPLTFIAQSIGLLLPLTLISWNAIDVLAHPLWFAYGSAATAVLYTYRNWLGYAGGLNLAVFIMSIIPVVFKRASDAAGSPGNSPGKVYFTAMVVYCVLILSSIWTVAYAFVPGGIYLRERTDLVLILQMACLSPAFSWPYLAHPTVSGRKNVVSPLHLSYSRATLVFFSIASLLVTMYRTPTGFPQPFKPGPRILTAGIWTVHFGIDNEGRDSQRLIKDVARDMELDVIGLLETDLHRVVFGNRDLTRVLLEEMGYYVDVGPGLASHTWGAVLLSKFPIINSTHHLLPSPNGELAPAIEAVLDVFGTYVTVVVAHNGQEQDPLDRELQSTELARILAASYPRPVLFLGYLVTNPHAPRPAPYEIMVDDGQVFDIDEEDWDRWCEYIFYRGMYRTAYARISRGKVTDTELQIGQFVLPAHGTSVVDDSKEARYLRSYKEDLPEDHWFPMSYYHYNGGQGEHFYHVFDTPLYYKIPTAKDPPL
ncbi:Frag1/DRAM/Sfk1 family-domain-containing protein [Mycena galericulata]|nr:Frag1/DRAM/Sfk1 family-domain-containing protein [Mycena galericulata]